MQDRKVHISRIFSLLLVLLILFVSYNPADSRDKVISKKEQKEQENNKGQEKKAEISEFSVEAILPIISFQVPDLNFSHISLADIELRYEAELFQKTFSTSHHFRKLFTCIIAINAP